jgi:cysteine synthase
MPPALNREIIDRVYPVLEGSAAAMTLRLAREEGLLGGLSSGAALDAASAGSPSIAVVRHRRRNLPRWRPRASAMTASQGAMFESERLTAV